MINFYFIIDLIHHENNKELLSLFENKEDFFEFSESLFSSLPEKHLSNISPILCKVNQHSASIIRNHLNNKPESILYVASSLNLSQLSRHLQNYMEFRLQDGRSGLIRLYDPRIFKGFNNMLTNNQRATFWRNIAYIKGWDDVSQDYYIEEQYQYV